MSPDRCVHRREPKPARCLDDTVTVRAPANGVSSPRNRPLPPPRLRRPAPTLAFLAHHLLLRFPRPPATISADLHPTRSARMSSKHTLSNYGARDVEALLHPTTNLVRPPHRQARSCSKKPRASTSTTNRANAISKASPDFGARRWATATRNLSKPRAHKWRSCPSRTCSAAAATSPPSNSPRKSKRSRPAQPRRCSSPRQAAKPTTARSSCSGITTTRAA